MAYINESEIEEAHIKLFKTLDYEHENGWKNKPLERETLKEVVLKKRLHKALIKLNPHLPQIAIDDAVYELTKSRSILSEIEANQEIYELIKNGISLSFTNEEGNEENTKLKVISFDKPKENDFLVVSQLTIENRDNNHHRRPDLILYVNGLPLVMVELKRPNVQGGIRTGFDKNLQDYKKDIPQLFYYNLFVLISDGIDTRIGAFDASWEHFFQWKRIDEKETPQLSLEFVSKALCNKDTLIDYLENFVLYHKQSKKIIGKNHQYLGVNATVASLKNSDKNGKIGTFWHTQGSGKSYSMIFFTKKVERKLNGNWSFLILTDRKDLDDQIFKNFLDTQTFKLSKNKKRSYNQYRAKGEGSRKQLEEALGKNKNYYFSTIFNFGIAKGKQYTQKSDRDDWIVLVDEAHRSQYKGYGENIKIALPNAKFIAFTGTPIKKGGLTEQWFGKCISEYNFAQSIEDGSTVPIYYKKSVPRVEQINEELVKDAGEILDGHDLTKEEEEKLNRDYSTLFEVVKRDDRLNEIAQHIVKHFPLRLDMQNDEGERKPMKAMVVSIDKFTALKMYDKVQHFVKEKIKLLRKNKKQAKNEEDKRVLNRQIQFLLETKMAVVISMDGSEKEEEEKFAKYGLDIKPHRKLMNQPDEDGKDIEEYFKDPNSPYRIVFVTAMWMTGFDAPSVSTLYLDKPMKNHTLMQTIARCNRVFEAKKNGLIVDYFGIFRNLQKALSLYAEGSSGTTSPLDMPVKELDELLKLLEEAIDECKSYLKKLKVDIDKIHKLGDRGFKEVTLFRDYANLILEKDEYKKAFNLYVNTIVSLYDSAKPEVYSTPRFKEERDLFLYLKEMVNRKIDKSDILEKVRDEVDTLLDSSIIGEGDLLEYKVKDTINNYEEINLSRLDFEALRKEFPHKEHKHIAFTDLREFMELKLKQMMAKNKSRGKFLEDFEKIIDDYNNGSFELEEAYNRLIKEANILSQEESRAVREGLTEEQLEIFDLLKKEKLTLAEKADVKKASIALLEVLKEKKINLFVNPWFKEGQKQESVKNEIRDVLNQYLPNSYNRDIFMVKNDKIYTYIYTLAENGDARYLCA